MAKKKSTFWRDLSIGITSSIIASLIVATYLESRISTLKAELEAW